MEVEAAAGRAPPWWQTALLVLGLSALAATPAYFSLFSTFAAYDDEGYVMISVKHFLDGQPLYDQVYSQYGPAYYLGYALYHRVPGVEVTHDAVRLRTVLVWLAVAAACAVFLVAVTRSLLAGALGQVAVFLHLEHLKMEPGHPQEPCVLLVMATLLLSLLAGPGRRTRAMLVGLGAAAGIALLTKLNVGGLLFLAVSLVLLANCRPFPGASAVRWLLGVAVLGLPAALMASRLSHAPAAFYGAVATVSLAPVVLALCGNTGDGGQPALLGWRDLLLFGGSLLLTVLAICAGCLATGTSPAGLFQGVIWQHRRFADFFYLDAPVHWSGLVVAPLALGLALRSIGPFRSRPAGGVVSLAQVKWVFGAAVLTVAGLHYAREGPFVLEHGLQLRGGSWLLLTFATPFAWLVLLPPESAALSPGETFARQTLAAVTVLQALVAYPVPGTQVALATFLLLVTAVICLQDALRAPGPVPTARHLARGLALALVLVALALKTAASVQRHQDGVPLGLAGADRLRLPREQAETYVLLTRNVQGHADTFVSVYGFNSLHFWSGVGPPTSLNATFWPWLLDDEQQRRIVAALDRHENACVVRDPEAQATIEQMAGLPRPPLVQYLRDNFRVVGKIGPYEFLVRNQREPPPLLTSLPGR